MKQIILTAGFFLGLVFTAGAQTKAGIHFGYGSEIDRPAIGANAEFGIMDKLSVAPDFTYYFTENLIYVKTNVWELNGNVHYYFWEQDKFRIFGLGGLNYTRVSVTADNIFGSGNETTINSEIGFNVGGGATFDINDKFQAFSTLKYTVASTEQLALFAGVRYKF